MSWKRILFVLGCLAAVGFIFAHIASVSELLKVIHGLRWYILITVVAVQLLSYFFQAKFHQAFLDNFGHHVDMRRLYELSLAINFTDLVLPSFGISGASLLAAGLKDQGVPPGRSALAHLFRYFFLFLTFPVILFLGFVMLYLGGEIGPIGKLVVLLVVGILGATLIAIPLVGHRARAEVAVHWFVRTLNRLARRFGRPQLIRLQDVDQFLDEFYSGYHELLANKRSWLWPLVYALAINGAEVLTIYVIFLSFGHVVNLGAVITGYALANMLSQIGFVTGGLVVYEAVMIGTFAALGVSLALATPVVIIYRVVFLFLFLIPGLYYYRKYLR